jgi:hypothetical protein
MSDNDSDASSPARSNNARPLPPDFPLSVVSSVAALQRQFDHISRRIRRSARHNATAPPPSDPVSSLNSLLAALTPPGLPAGFHSARYNSADADQQQSSMSRPRTSIEHRPITTLVSALPPTTYREQEDSQGSINTLAYVRVQRTLLEYLDTHAADTLSPRQARKWTQDIDPTDKEPKAADALRLCYYMRSQGYDVYGKIENKRVLLYRRQNNSHKDQDVLYWKQDFTTNRVEYAAPAAPSAPRISRRNAMPDTGDHEEMLRRRRADLLAQQGAATLVRQRELLAATPAEARTNFVTLETLLQKELDCNEPNRA